MSLPVYAMNLASFPEIYERQLVGPLFRPFAETTLDHLDLDGCKSLLDVACGTGIGARVGRERLGAAARIVGVDVSEPMLAVAAAVAPDIDWRAGDAVSLPLTGTETFDVVVCHQGLQFFSNKEAALRELRRASAPGARVAVAVWRAVEEMPPLHDLQKVAERHFGPIDDRRYAFGDAGTLERMLLDAGFRDVRLEAETRTITFNPGSVFVHLNTWAFAGMSPTARAMQDEARAEVMERIIEDSKQALPPGAFDAMLELQMVTNLALCRV